MICDVTDISFLYNTLAVLGFPQVGISKSIIYYRYYWYLLAIYAQQTCPSLNNLMLSYFVNSWYRYMPTLVGISQKLGIDNTCNTYFWQVPAIWKSKSSILPIYYTGSYKYNETILYAHVAQKHWTFIGGKIVNQHLP